MCSDDINARYVQGRATQGGPCSGRETDLEGEQVPMLGALESAVPSNTEKAALEGQQTEGPAKIPSMTGELCAGAALVGFTETRREFSIQQAVIRRSRRPDTKSNP